MRGDLIMEKAIQVVIILAGILVCAHFILDIVQDLIINKVLRDYAKGKYNGTDE